jgi:SAM-dependent methyltransferase
MRFGSANFSLVSAIRLLGFDRIRRMRKAGSAGWEALIGPHFITRVVQTLYQVGFIDALRDHAPVNALEFAEEHDLDGPLLVGLCDALYARGFLAREGNRYSLDAGGRFLVETDLVRGWFDLAYGYEVVLNRMEPLLRRQSTYGHDVARDGRHVAVGSGLASMDFYFPIVCNFIQRGGYRKVLDIGCGDGTFLNYLCDRIPGLQGVGVDLSPDAVTAGNERLVAGGLESRISLHVGDAMEISRLKRELEGVDAAATFFVLHELCDRKDNPRAVQFLREFRRALPGVPLHVVETIRPEPEDLRRRPGMAIEYFLFHDLSLQKPIGREAWKKAFREAGYESLKENYIAFARSAVYTAK